MLQTFTNFPEARRSENKKGDEIPLLWPYQDSNLDLKFRKLPFYPLNYKAK